MTVLEDQQALDAAVRLFIMRAAAETGGVPGHDDVASGLGIPRQAVEGAVMRLGAGRAFILAPNSSAIWAADPFCAVPSAFRVRALGRTYFGICIWDALGVLAALHADGEVAAACGDCGAPMSLHVQRGVLVLSDGVVHFGVPAARFWDNIAFT